MKITPLTGLIAAAHTPMKPDGALNLKAVEAQAAHLLRNRIAAVFIGGSTGESHSLAVAERLQLARRWSEVLRGTPLKLIVHVGHNSLPEARRLAADAQRHQAAAISALAPNYFKPATTADLADFCADIAAAAPGLPFYFYDIPALTGVSLPMDEFLTVGRERIPTLAGLKFTNPDMMKLQQCLHHSGGAFDILYGNDEFLLAGLAFGVRGAIGSTYNVIAPVFHRLRRAFQRGDLAAARAAQLDSVEYVRICASFGYLRAAKAALGFLGVECGPVRRPLRPLDAGQVAALREQLERAGFGRWTAGGQ